jgi:hypothetical protein
MRKRRSDVVDSEADLIQLLGDIIQFSFTTIQINTPALFMMVSTY